MNIFSLSLKIKSFQHNNLLSCLGCKTRIGNPQDCSSSPLFTGLVGDILNRPIYQKLKALYENYVPEVTTVSYSRRSFSTVWFGLFKIDRSDHLRNLRIILFILIRAQRFLLWVGTHSKSWLVVQTSNSIQRKGNFVNHHGYVNKFIGPC